MSHRSASAKDRYHGSQKPKLRAASIAPEQASSSEEDAVHTTPPKSRRVGVERVDAPLLAVLLEDPSVRIIDVRRQPVSLHGLYASGHIPGAIWLDVDSVLDGARRTPRSMLEFAAVMARHGVGDRHLVVLYDEGKFGTAAALARTMVEFGHPTVGVLVGGWERWVAGGQPIEQASREYPPASFTARRGGGQ
jgi:thiosulfate/3-mercaptopyruvate sulfurtransferase